MADGVIPGIVDMIRGFHDRAKQAKIDAAMQGNGDPAHNYFNDPQGVINNAMQIDPATSLQMEQDYTTRSRATTDWKAKRVQDQVGFMSHFLRGLPQGSDYGAAIDSISPLLTQQGGDPAVTESFKKLVAANPAVLAGMDDKVYEKMMEDQYSNTVGTPGSHVIRGGKLIDTVPFAPEAVTTPANGATTSIFDKNTGQFVTPGAPYQPGPNVTAPSATNGSTAAPGLAPASAPVVPASGLTVEALRPHFKQQESSGDYTAVNADSGALGAYGIMPETGKAIAQRLKLAWRPDMMHKDDPASRRYQDAIGGEAISDAIAFSQGDPNRMSAYYFAGPNQKMWGPKTAAYQRDMSMRLSGVDPRNPNADTSGGAGPTVTPYGVTTAPKKTPHVRMATPEELKGYPPGTAAQIDETGKLQNLRVPAKPVDLDAAVSTYTEAKASISDIRENLLKLRDDPELAKGTGVTGYIMSWLPSTHARYLSGLAAQINAQKLVGLATALKSTGGNPFQRITNMEAQQLPKTLGNFDLTQNIPDLKRNINDALAQLDRLEGRLDGGAERTGLFYNYDTPADQGGSSGEAPVNTVVQTSNGPQIKTTQGWKPAKQTANGWEAQ